MAPILVIALTLLAALAILVPIAVVQRRSSSRAPIAGELDTAPTSALPVPRGVPLPAPKPTRPQRALTSGQVALGVFLGMWCFAISAALIVFALIAIADPPIGRR